MSNKIYTSFHGYGVDVASNRVDDLDRRALEHITNTSSAYVLDVGCGALGFSKQVAQLGVPVLAIDIEDYSQCNNTNSSLIEFTQADVNELGSWLVDKNFTDGCMQRTLHYLTYVEARELLSVLHQAISNKLFISVTGLESDIGREYLGRSDVLATRFAELTDTGKEKFHITKPVCLYTQAELRLLLEDTGWKIEMMWMSAFKNIKAVCSH
jgi:hypothetical protein